MRRNRTLALGAALLALVISACSPGGGEGTDGAESPAADLPDITIASAGFWESAVVAEIYAQALEGAGFTVERQLELGARDVTHPGLIDGQIDLMPEYVGGYLAVTYGGEPTSDLDATLEELRGLLEADGLVALDPTPGTDADGFAVRQETADEFSLATLSDLAEVAGDLTWGVAPECGENPNCGIGLEEVYGIDFASLDDRGAPGMLAGDRRGAQRRQHRRRAGVHDVAGDRRLQPRPARGRPGPRARAEPHPGRATGADGRGG